MEKSIDVKLESSNIRRIDADILRGIGIILVMMGHIWFGSKFNIWIYGFHIPLFYIISGYFFRNGTVNGKNFLAKKMKQLLIPYFIFSIGGIIIMFAINGGNYLFVINEIKDMLISPNIGLPVFGALWFLPVLFWMNIFFYYLCKFIKKRNIICLTSILVGFMGMSFTQLFKIQFSFGIDAAIIGMSFLGTGYGLRHYSDKSIIKKGMNINITVLLILVIANVSTILFNGEVNFRTGDLKCLVLTYVNAVIGTILFWNIAKKMEYLYVKTSFKYPILWIKKIGEHSIAYLCMHQFILLVLYRSCGNVEYMGVNSAVIYFLKLFYLAVIIVAVEGMRRIIEKMRLNIILGK